MASSITASSAITASTTSTTNNNNNSSLLDDSLTNNNINNNDIKVSPIIMEETADEVKVFRSNTNDDDPNELAGSSADLNADKQELALEADIESQADFTQQFNPIFNPFTTSLPWPQPGSNFMFNQLLALSPAYIAHQKMVAAATISQVYTAAMAAQYLAKHSPNYFGTQFNAAAAAAASLQTPPAFSMGQPCTPNFNNSNNNNNNISSSTSQNCFQQQHHQNIGSPMTSLGGFLGNISLSNDRGNSSNCRYDIHQQQNLNADRSYTSTPLKRQQQLKTSKREHSEHRIKEKQQHHNSKSVVNSDGKREHIKKPMNAFMLFMKENRHKYMDDYSDKRKQSAELNKELGKIWQDMSKEEQQPYYEMAQQKREEHQKLYPNWTARENYAIHKKAKRRRTRERSLENNEQKKCRARYGVDNQAKWCKHCRRKKRCLNVRDSDSPAQEKKNLHLLGFEPLTTP